MAINPTNIKGQNVYHLFDPNNPSISFNNLVQLISIIDPIIYTVWDKDIYVDDKSDYDKSNYDGFVYVGACGLKKASPVKRFKEFQKGERSGNQFCTYVHDYYVIKAILNTRSYKPKKGSLDDETGKYIRNNLFYRFVTVNAANIGNERSMVNDIRKGGAGFPAPLLNGIPSKW